jgi:hypothetical protein
VQIAWAIGRCDRWLFSKHKGGVAVELEVEDDDDDADEVMDGESESMPPAPERGLLNEPPVLRNPNPRSLTLLWIFRPKDAFSTSVKLTRISRNPSHLHLCIRSRRRLQNELSGQIDFL